jgi:hypothetical protein
MNQETEFKNRSNERRHAWDALYDSTTMRLVDLMGGHEWIRWRADLIDALSPQQRSKPFRHAHAATDRSYFMHRAQEERRAARSAVGRKARAAHDELAARYEELVNNHRKK